MSAAVVKNILVLSIVCVFLSGCRFGSGELTLFWLDKSSVSITRVMENESGDDGSWKTGACIALPNDFEQSVTATWTGTYQENGTTTELSTSANTFADGVDTVISHYPLEGYIWQCFSDVARDYADTDQGSVSFELYPSITRS